MKRILKYKASKEQLRYRLELRRSNAATPHRNKKLYSRKLKHGLGELYGYSADSGDS